MVNDTQLNHVAYQKKVEEVKKEEPIQPKPEPKKEIVIPVAKATKTKKKRIFKRRKK